MKRGMGLDVSRRFYGDLVRPVLVGTLPGLPHAAARIGLGSEVLGYDTELSRDHDYGPAVQVLLPAEDFDRTAAQLLRALDGALPVSFDGLPVRYPTAVRPPSDASGQGMKGSNHGVEFYTLDAWCLRFLGRTFHTEPTNLEWLSYPEHFFLMVTAGAVFVDELGDLTALRGRLDYFPRDVWLYKLAAQWNRVAEDRALVGRTGMVGDELGSRVIASRMIGNLMKLALLIERRYAPYAKWLGSAFAEVPVAKAIRKPLSAALSASHWKEREAHLFEACWTLAELQRNRQVPGSSAPTEAQLQDRPFRFVDTVKIAEGIKSAISDVNLAQMPLFGGADQFLGNFVLAVPDWSMTAAGALLRSNMCDG